MLVVVTLLNPLMEKLGFWLGMGAAMAIIVTLTIIVTVLNAPIASGDRHSEGGGRQDTQRQNPADFCFKQRRAWRAPQPDALKCIQRRLP
jgi:hypothetical protein